MRPWSRIDAVLLLLRKIVDALALCPGLGLGVLPLGLVAGLVSGVAHAGNRTPPPLPYRAAGQADRAAGQADRAAGQADGAAGQADGAAERASPFADVPARRELRIDEVVENLTVLVRKLEEPTAVTTLGPDVLTRLGARQIGDLSATVPNLQVSPPIGPGLLPELQLRGLGALYTAPARSGPVGIEIDGVPQAGVPISLLALGDLERVEVQRGPQSAVGPRSSLAGRVQIRTQRPTQAFEARARLRVAERIESGLMLNVPLVPERAALRLNLVAATREGLSSPILGRMETPLAAGRLQVLARPTGRAEVLLASDFSLQGDAGGEVGVLARLAWELAPDHSLTWISAWRRRRTEPLGNAERALPGGSQERLSQEIRLEGRSGLGLRYVIGLFGERERGQADAVGLAPATGGLPVGAASGFAGHRRDRRSGSLYARATIPLTPSLELILGARAGQQRERVRRVGCPDAVACVALTAGSVDGSARTRDLGSMVALGYEPVPGLRLYASASRGSLGGGIDDLGTLGAAPVAVAPHDLRLFELGIKSSWLGERLTVDGALFEQQLDRPRIPTAAGAIGEVGAVGATSLVYRAEARDTSIRGGELEVRALPGEGLRLVASLGLLRGRYRGLEGDRSEGALPGVTERTLGLALDYETSAGRLGTLALSTAWRHRSAVAYREDTPRAIDRIAPVHLLEARISLLFADARTELAVFGTNLLDDDDPGYGGIFDGSGGYAARIPGRGRQLGVEVRREF